MIQKLLLVIYFPEYQRLRCTYNNHLKNFYVAAKKILPQEEEHKLQEPENKWQGKYFNLRGKKLMEAEELCPNVDHISG